MDPIKNPYAALLAKLSGVKPPPIRARQGWQQMMHERYKEDVAPAVEAAWAEKLAAGLSPTDKNNAPFHGEITRKLFAGLSTEKKDGYERAAKLDKERGAAAYKEAVNEGFASKSPEKRQA